MELLIERAFDAPTDRVFRAFIDPADLVEWIAPDGYRVQPGSVSVDANVGGHQRLTLVADDGSTSPVDLTYTAAVENTLLAGEELVPATGDREEYVLSWRAEFQDAGEQTQLVLRQGPFSKESGAEARVNWESAFAKLDARLAG
jgi:uncharacterized protein YndB with AHSA1/START domain